MSMSIAILSSLHDQLYSVVFTSQYSSDSFLLQILTFPRVIGMTLLSAPLHTQKFRRSKKC